MARTTKPEAKQLPGPTENKAVAPVVPAETQEQDAHTQAAAPTPTPEPAKKRGVFGFIAPTEG